jgi:hypothetical protein
MTSFEFDSTPMGGNMYAVHEGERKIILSVGFSQVIHLNQ